LISAEHSCCDGPVGPSTQWSDSSRDHSLSPRGIRLTCFHVKALRLPY